MSNSTKSVKNLIFSLFGQIITIALGLILPRLWIVSYGSEVNGLLSSLSQFLVYLGLFEAGIGTATLQALFKPISQKNWDEVSGVLSATHKYYKRTGRWYFLGLLAMSLLYPVISNSSLSYATVFGAVFFSGIGNVVSFYFQGKYVFLLSADGKSYITKILSTVSFIANSFLKVILIPLNVNIVIILAAGFIVQCIPAFYTLWYVKKHYPDVRIDARPNDEALSQKNYVLVHQISSLIFRNTDVLILTTLCDLKIVSVYSMFKLIITQVEQILQIPFDSVNFALGQLYQTDKSKFIRQIDVAESLNGAAYYSIFSVTLFLFLPFMRLYTKGVTDVNYIDPWLAILFILIALFTCIRIPMLQTIMYAGHFKSTLKASIIESVINLVVSISGAIILGIYGVLLGTVAALLYRTNDIIIYSNRKILDRSPWKTYAVHLVNMAAFLALQLLFPLLIDSLWVTSYLRFIVAGLVCTPIALVVVFGAQLLFFPECRKTVVVFFKQLLKKLHILH